MIFMLNTMVEIFDHDKDNWNKDYMNGLMVQVVYNFSHERIKHLKEVVTYVYSNAKKK